MRIAIALAASALLVSACATGRTAAEESAAALPATEPPQRVESQLDPADIKRVEPPTSEAPVAPTEVTVAGLGGIPVDQVGVTEDGQAEIPEDIQRVGWYQYGPGVGSTQGSVVLMGHRDGTGARGALYNLGSVGVGETITLTGAGQPTTYRVVSNESISKQVVPLADLFQRTGDPRLVIISCGGEYVADQGGYLDNVVLTAVPVAG